MPLPARYILTFNSCCRLLRGTQKTPRSVSLTSRLGNLCRINSFTYLQVSISRSQISFTYLVHIYRWHISLAYLVHTSRSYISFTYHSHIISASQQPKNIHPHPYDASFRRNTLKVLVHSQLCFSSSRRKPGKIWRETEAKAAIQRNPLLTLCCSR